MNIEIITKRCRRCNIVKPVSDFGKRKRMKSGIHEWCKCCISETGSNRRKTKDGLVVVIYLRQKRNAKHRKMDAPSYSKEELKEWMFSQNLFHELHKKWTESGYKRDFVPSVDRKNDYISYTIDNIQLMTWKDNSIKCARDRILGINNKKSRAVIQIDFNGNVMQDFYSMAEASRQTGIGDSHINQVCTGKRNHAGGYKWKFKKAIRDIQ